MDEQERVCHMIPVFVKSNRPTTSSTSAKVRIFREEEKKKSANDVDLDSKRIRKQEIVNFEHFRSLRLCAAHTRYHFNAKPMHASVGDFRLGSDWCVRDVVVANAQAVIHQIKYGRPSVAQMDL